VSDKPRTSDQLEKLAELHAAGVLSDDEFIAATARMVSTRSQPKDESSTPTDTATRAEAEQSVELSDDQPHSTVLAPGGLLDTATQSPLEPPVGEIAADDQAPSSVGETAGLAPVGDASDSRHRSRAWKAATAAAFVLLVASAAFYATRSRDVPPISPRMVVDVLARGGVGCEGFEVVIADPREAWVSCNEGAAGFSIYTSTVDEVVGPGTENDETQDLGVIAGVHAFSIVGPHWQVQVGNYETALEIQRILGGHFDCIGCGGEL
jgi:anti-sigma-K factor RskA